MCKLHKAPKYHLNLYNILFALYLEFPELQRSLRVLSKYINYFNRACKRDEHEISNDYSFGEVFFYYKMHDYIYIYIYCTSCVFLLYINHCIYRN